VPPRRETTLIVLVGDIHGRFHRVRDWLANLEGCLDRPIDMALAVGDIEAFRTADDHRRKAAKRTMPAEFADYATGRCRMDRALYFIGGNNEDFEALHPMPAGGELAPDFHYLGRHGVRSIAGLRTAYLSGIFAPRYIDKPLQEPTTPESARQAGYFRDDEVRAVEGLANEPVDLMLVHEWPRGMISRANAWDRGCSRDLRAFRTPWIGNGHTRSLVEKLEPGWVFCGHSHTAFATRFEHASGRVDQPPRASIKRPRPDGAVFWLEFEGAKAIRAGWGVEGEVAWRAGQRWDESCTPEAGVMERLPRRVLARRAEMAAKSVSPPSTARLRCGQGFKGGLPRASAPPRSRGG
jgi:lariat debranching enzyme